VSLADTYYTVSQAATLLGVKRQAIYGAIARGVLDTDRIDPTGHGILIPHESLERYRAERAGRPGPKRSPL